MPSYAAIAPIAQHRGREPQLAGDLHQWPTAACQQGDCLRLELIRKMTPFLAHSTPSRSPRSLAKVSTNSGEAHPIRRPFRRQDTPNPVLIIVELFLDRGATGDYFNYS